MTEITDTVHALLQCKGNVDDLLKTGCDTKYQHGKQEVQSELNDKNILTQELHLLRELLVKLVHEVVGLFVRGGLLGQQEVKGLTTDA
jgi:hypothetical protein